jgi:replicative DNA helicase
MNKKSQEINNIKAEQMLLGAVLINPTLIKQVNKFLRAEHFFEPLHQKIYSSIEIVSDKGLTPSVITLKSMLDQDPLFIELNGEEYLIKLTLMAMVVINPHEYGKIIFDLAIKRNLIQTGEDIVNAAYDSTSENTRIDQLEIKLKDLEFNISLLRNLCNDFVLKITELQIKSNYCIEKCEKAIGDFEKPK